MFVLVHQQQRPRVPAPRDRGSGSAIHLQARHARRLDHARVARGSAAGARGVFPEPPRDAVVAKRVTARQHARTAQGLVADGATAGCDALVLRPRLVRRRVRCCAGRREAQGVHLEQRRRRLHGEQRAEGVRVAQGEGVAREQHGVPVRLQHARRAGAGQDDRAVGAEVGEAQHASRVEREKAMRAAGAAAGTLAVQDNVRAAVPPHDGGGWPAVPRRQQLL